MLLVPNSQGTVDTKAFTPSNNIIPVERKTFEGAEGIAKRILLKW